MFRDAYAQFAPYYDELEFDVFSQQCIQYLDDLLAHFKFQGKTVLDLACGTGTAAMLLAKRGFQVTGVDISQPMIKVARKKAKEMNIPVRFYTQDMRKLKLNQQFDLVTCFFDAMNHLFTERDFSRACRNVAKILTPGGLFIFDLNTNYGLATQWHNFRKEERKENLRSLFVSRYEPRKKMAILNATLYVFEGIGKKPKKYTGKFANRAYTPEQVYRALNNAGLSLLAEYECFTFTPPTEHSSRIMYLTRK